MGLMREEEDADDEELSPGITGGREAGQDINILFSSS